MSHKRELRELRLKVRTAQREATQAKREADSLRSELSAEKAKIQSKAKEFLESERRMDNCLATLFQNIYKKQLINNYLRKVLLQKNQEMGNLQREMQDLRTQASCLRKVLLQKDQEMDDLQRDIQVLLQKDQEMVDLQRRFNCVLFVGAVLSVLVFMYAFAVENDS